jgi:biopolymer transport protein ExbD
MAKAVRVVTEPVLFSDINVTPFIDVMLVLLIVMILSIPVATHKIPIDLPSGDTPLGPQQPPHQLAIDRAGTLYWDGARVTDAQAREQLAAIGHDPRAVLHMNTDPEARYARFDAVLADVKRAGVDRLGFVGHRPLDD